MGRPLQAQICSFARDEDQRSLELEPQPVRASACIDSVSFAESLSKPFAVYMATHSKSNCAEPLRFGEQGERCCNSRVCCERVRTMAWSSMMPPARSPHGYCQVTGRGLTITRADAKSKDEDLQCSCGMQGALCIGSKQQLARSQIAPADCEVGEVAVAGTCT